MATHQKGPAERRYHKIAVALWSGREFRGLSERAKLLYLRLAVGPETTPIPGVARLSRSGLALDELRWGLAEFDARLAELQQAGLAEVDLDAGLVVLPRELAEPFSLPNGLPSVTSWRRAAANAPDCELRDQVKERVIAKLATKGPKWVATFCTPGDDGEEGNDEGPQPGLFAGKLPPPVPSSVPPKVHIQNQIQTQSHKGEAPARKMASSRGEPPAVPVWRAVTLPPDACVGDVPDLSAWAVPETPLSAGPEAARLDRKEPAHPPPVPAPRKVAAAKQGTLPLMPAPDPEHCAWVVAKHAGKLFAHGPLLPGRDTPLGGELHPTVRAEWQRVLSEYFGPLHYTAEQVDSTLTALGKWIQQEGKLVTLQVLVKFRGERLQQYVSAALAWSGATAGRPTPSRPPDESRRYPLRQAEDRRGLAAAAVLGAAKRQLDRLPDEYQAAAEQARMALFRMGTG